MLKKTKRVSEETSVAEIDYMRERRRKTEQWSRPVALALRLFKKKGRCCSLAVGRNRKEGTTGITFVMPRPCAFFTVCIFRSDDSFVSVDNKSHDDRVEQKNKVSRKTAIKSTKIVNRKKREDKKGERSTAKAANRRDEIGSWPVLRFAS